MNSTRLFRVFTSLIAAGALAGGCRTRPVAAPPAQSRTDPRETELCARLQAPDADLKAHVDACRELARIGSVRALPALAPLLTNAELSHMARYALEPVPGEAVNEALRQAANEAEGAVLAGLLTSLGVRRDTAAVSLLARHLTSPSPEIRRAAALALGEVATPEAVRALWTAWETAAPDVRATLGEALLRAAHRLHQAGQWKPALRIYEGVEASGVAPAHIRFAALQGRILMQGPRDVRLLSECLRSGDPLRVEAALAAAQQLPGESVTRALGEAASLLPPDQSLPVLQAVAFRGDPAGLPFLLQATNHPDPRVRVTAIQGLGWLGDPRAATALVPWAYHAEPELREAARSALAALPGAAAEQAIFSLLDADDPARQLAGLDLVRRRRLAAALPRLQRMVRTRAPEVRLAAIRLIGELGNRMQWNWLLTEVRHLNEREDLDAARQALLALATRIGAGPQETEGVLTALAGTGPTQAPVLYGVLAQLGGDRALRYSLATVRTGPQELRAAAFEALLQWRSPEVTEALLLLAREAPEADRRENALRRYLQWAADPELNAEQRLAMCRQASRLVEGAPMAHLYLAAVGGLSTPEVVTLVKPFLDSTETRDEACAALLNVAERLRKTAGQQPLPEPVHLAVQRVISLTPNEDLKRRAQALVNPGG
jgi:HEAT repeat protein